MTAVVPMTLYRLAEEHVALYAELEESGGELTPEIEARLAALAEALPRKVDGWAGFLRSLAAYADALEAEERELAARRRIARKASDRLRRWAQTILGAMGVRELRGTTHRLVLQRHGGLRPLEIHVAPEQLPVRYQRTVIQADTDLLRAEIEAGGVTIAGECVLSDVDGTSLATLRPRGESLQVR